MKRWLIRGLAVVPILTLSGALALNVSADSNSKRSKDPEAGLSDAKREALHKKAHDANDAFLKKFLATGGDPRSLPIVEVPTYGDGPTTLAAAKQEATLVIHGKVRSVTFASSPTVGMPSATTTVVAMGAASKGAAATGSILTIHQLGGPVAQAGTASGGAMAQLESDHVLLAGDEAVLMLTPDGPGAYRPLLGTGVNLVINGVVHVQDHASDRSLDGLSIDKAMQTLSTP